MIDIAKAIRIVRRETPLLGSERCDIAESVGRVLAEKVVADADMPPFDRSQMDGFAVIAGDTATAGMQKRDQMQKPLQSKGTDDTDSVHLRVVGESAAGRGWHKTLKRGEAVAIMTGAPVPKGADAVQKIELTRGKDWGEGGSVEVMEPVKPGSFIVKKGAEIKKGQAVFEAGEQVTENMIATLAAFGYAKVKIATPPRIAILSTGSEIVEIGKRPGRDQIRNSNSAMLAALCRRQGADPTIFPIAADDISSLKSQISEAIKGKGSQIPNPKSQILIVTGGVSVGKYDHTKAALVELGAEIFFDKVRLKPGKPTVFARLGKTLVFGLPGNPVSAAVTFHLFVRPAIMQMQSVVNTSMRTGYAVLAAAARAARERDTYLPASLATDPQGRLIATPLRWQGSSDFVGFARAEALIIMPKGKAATKGDVVRIAFL